MVCSKCGANNEAGSVFCGNCGTKIVTAQQAAQPGANMQYQQVPQAVPPVTKVIPPPTPQAIPPVTNIPPQPVYQQPMNGAPVMLSIAQAMTGNGFSPDTSRPEAERLFLRYLFSSWELHLSYGHLRLL